MRLLSLLVLPTLALGYQITFPTASDYWVACGFNNVRWTSDANDPPIFSVVLENTNKTLLNDDYSVGNSLNSKQGEAQIHVPCLDPAEHYRLSFVSVSNHQRNGVFVSSNEFSIKPNGTAPASNSRQTAIEETEDTTFAHASTNSSIILHGQGTGSSTVTTQKQPSFNGTATAANEGQKPVPTVPVVHNGGVVAMHIPLGLGLVVLSTALYLA